MDKANSDSWDWPYILYIGRKWLGYTDEQTMSMTPKYFRNQLSVHYDAHQRMYGTGEASNASTNAKVGFVDQIEGW